jgi:hypothetical protein
MYNRERFGEEEIAGELECRFCWTQRDGWKVNKFGSEDMKGRVGYIICIFEY